MKPEEVVFGHSLGAEPSLKLMQLATEAPGNGIPAPQWAHGKTRFHCPRRARDKTGKVSSL